MAARTCCVQACRQPVAFFCTRCVDHVLCVAHVRPSQPTDIDPDTCTRPPKVCIMAHWLPNPCHVARVLPVAGGSTEPTVQYRGTRLRLARPLSTRDLLPFCAYCAGPFLCEAGQDSEAGQLVEGRTLTVVNGADRDMFELDFDSATRTYFFAGISGQPTICDGCVEVTSIAIRSPEGKYVADLYVHRNNNYPAVLSQQLYEPHEGLGLQGCVVTALFRGTFRAADILAYTRVYSSACTTALLRPSSVVGEKLGSLLASPDTQKVSHRDVMLLGRPVRVVQSATHLRCLQCGTQQSRDLVLPCIGLHGSTWY